MSSRGTYAVALASMETHKVFSQGTVVAPSERHAICMLAQMAGCGLDFLGRVMSAGADWAVKRLSQHKLTSRESVLRIDLPHVWDVDGYPRGVRHELRLDDGVLTATDVGLGPDGEPVGPADTKSFRFETVVHALLNAPPGEIERFERLLIADSDVRELRADGTLALSLDDESNIAFCAARVG